MPTHYMAFLLFLLLLALDLKSQFCFSGRACTRLVILMVFMTFVTGQAHSHANESTAKLHGEDNLIAQILLKVRLAGKQKGKKGLERGLKNVNRDVVGTCLVLWILYMLLYLIHVSRKQVKCMNWQTTCHSLGLACKVDKSLQR